MMKLIYTPTSPFARKVRVVARECGHSGMEEVFDHPMAEGSQVATVNPLGKVPALVLDGGEVLIDSPVICEFLDQYNRTPTLVPASGSERFRVLAGQALGDGILDAAVNSVMELRRPEQKRSAFWLQRWHDAIDRSLGELETRVPDQGGGVDLAVITWACVLGYLEFRLPHMQWPEAHPKLAAWWKSIQDRPSLAQTAPGS